MGVLVWFGVAQSACHLSYETVGPVVPLTGVELQGTIWNGR